MVQMDVLRCHQVFQVSANKTQNGHVVPARVRCCKATFGAVKMLKQIRDADGKSLNNYSQVSGFVVASPRKKTKKKVWQVEQT